MSAPEPASDSIDEQPAAERGITVRAVEIAVSSLLLALGALVVFDSRRLGSSWGSDGPEAGYFPFYIGLIICLASAAILTQAVLNRDGRGHAVFVAWGPLRHVLA